jgi:hypothetical protein
MLFGKNSCVLVKFKLNGDPAEINVKSGDRLLVRKSVTSDR